MFWSRKEFFEREDQGGHESRPFFVRERGVDN
jgi:hypothetical protein